MLEGAMPTANDLKIPDGRVSMTRMPQRLRKLVLTVYIIISVGWLGLVLAMLVLGVIAATTRDVGTLKAAYVFIDVFANVIFPPAAVGALLSGIILSAGTKWGFLRHYWVVAKLVLNVAVILSAILFTQQWLERVIATASGSAANTVTNLEAGSLPMQLTYVSVVHLLMLGAATLISVYKPWGKTWFVQRKAAQPLSRAGMR
jgi:hypothetical protein